MFSSTMSLTHAILMHILLAACWARHDGFQYATTRTRCEASAASCKASLFNAAPSTSNVKRRSSPRSSSRFSLTAEPCTTTAQCKAPRKCISEVSEDGPIPCGAESSCFCLPEIFTSCDRSSTCDDGEVCVKLTNGDYCIAESVAEDERVSSAQGAVTLEDCHKTSDCEGNRACMVFGEDSIEPCEGRDRCFCIPDSGLATCSYPSDCHFGETCIIAEGVDFDFCGSEAIAEEGIFWDLALAPVEGVLTLDVCTHSKDCQQADCFYVTDVSNNFPLCYDRNDCRCLNIPPENCGRQADCKVPGETCACWRDFEAFCISKEIVDDDPEVHLCESITPSPKIRTSPSPSPSSFPSPPGPIEGCIDAKALEQFETTDLVYATHREVKALCDGNGSCATPGHMVLFRGESMMMKTYCAIAGCHERVIMVNSPRYKRQLVVESKTSDLLFTSFAARYETRSEEIALSALVRIGL